MILPDVGNSSEPPYGLLVETTAYVRLDALPLFFGAKWTEDAWSAKQTAALNGHTVTFTAYGAQELVDGHPRTLAVLPVRYAGHLYVPARALAEALRLSLTREYSPETFILCQPGNGMKAIVGIAVKVSHIAADFAGDGVTEQAYATRAVPGDTTPSLVWVARGTQDIWQRVLGNGNSRAIVNLQARDLTGDGRPELTCTCWFIGAYVDAVGFTAFQWQNKQHTFRNIMGPESDAGFLTYPASNRGTGGIMLQPGNRAHAPQTHLLPDGRALRQHPPL